MGTVSKRTFIAGVASAALLSGGGAVLLTAPEGSAGEGPDPGPTVEMGYGIGPALTVHAGGSSRPVPVPPPPGAPGMPGDDSAVADYLGMSREELFKARGSGKSLAEIAEDQGKSVDGLKDVMLDAYRDQLDDIVNQKGPVIKVFHGGKPPMGFPGPFPGPGPGLEDSAITDYLGMSREELFRARRDGKSLAEIASDQGKSVDGLKDAIVAATKERLADAVKHGPLTQDQADKMLEELSDHVDDLVNDDHPFMFGGGTFRMHPHP
jgi:hypothetical protein